MKNEKIYTIKSGDSLLEFRYSSGDDNYPLLATRLKLRDEQYKDLCTMTEEMAKYWQEWLQLRDIKTEVCKHFGNYRLIILETICINVEFVAKHNNPGSIEPCAESIAGMPNHDLHFA